MLARCYIAMPPENVSNFLTFSGSVEMEYWAEMG